MLNITSVRNNVLHLRQVATLRQANASKDFRQGNFDRALREADAADTFRRQADSIETNLESILEWSDASTGGTLDLSF